MSNGSNTQYAGPGIDECVEHAAYALNHCTESPVVALDIVAETGLTLPDVYASLARLKEQWPRRLTFHAFTRLKRPYSFANAVPQSEILN